MNTYANAHFEPDLRGRDGLGKDGGLPAAAAGLHGFAAENQMKT